MTQTLRTANRVLRGCLAGTALAAGLAITTGVSTASAQFFPTRRTPPAWFTIGVGTFSASEVDDEKTASRWDFGSATSPQYRISLERGFRNESAFGLTATYVRAPIVYRGDALSSTSCAACDADVTIWGLYGTFHAGGGPGLHQVIQASAGAARYQGFRRESDGAELEPKSDTDLSVEFAYGFGFTMSERTQINLMQQYGFNFHGGGSGAGSNTLRTTSTRLGIRMRLGTGARRSR